MQTHPIPWLTPKRMRHLTIAAMVAAGLVSTVGMSGSSTATAAATHSVPAHQAAAQR